MCYGRQAGADWARWHEDKLFATLVTIPLSGEGLVEWMQPYLERTPIPAGSEQACQQGRWHATTMWDHLQREVQQKLQARDPNHWQKVSSRGLKEHAGTRRAGEL